MENLVEPESLPVRIHYWVVAYNEVGRGPMQSNPAVFPYHEDGTDWALILVLVGVAVAAAVAELLFVRRNRIRPH